MKTKSNVKIPRRTAGLQIHAALEPRPDSGANLASDIFRAVKENEKAKAKLAQKTDFSSVTTDSKATFPQTTPDSLVADDSKPLDLAKPIHPERAAEAASRVIAAAPLISLSGVGGGGQMRVVSLQQPKSRKTNKQPRKPLQIVASANEPQKIPMLFERTKAEELYDLLYQLTLGADEPCDSVRVRRSDLMASTNIKTRLTLDLNLKRLEENELLKIESRPGEQEGNIYTVFPLPESAESR